MKKSYSIALLFAFLSTNLFSQELNRANDLHKKVNTALANYFGLQRENIHAHFDKEVFLTNEEIWFKGYVYNRKSKQPSYNTSNVFAILLDENGQKIDEKLLFASNGNFTGNFKLDKKYASGYYYIQFFTNWMNNFTEDESGVFRIEIINEDNPKRLSKKPENLTTKIEFYPEGGNLIRGIKNSIGVKAYDCYGDASTIKELKIVDEKNQIVTTVFLNAFGYGRFDITPLSLNYKALIEENDLKTEIMLPQSSLTGFNLQVNNFILDSKTLVKISTTPEYVSQIKNKRYIVAINNDENTSFVEVDFNNGKNEQNISFENNTLLDGINTIRLLNEDLSELATRMVFKFPKTESDFILKASSKGDNSIELKGEIPFPNASLSVSILPENSIAGNYRYDIYSSLLLNSNLSERIKDASSYFSNKNQNKELDIDLLMLNQSKAKYNWHDILTNPAKKTYDSDSGLTIRGVISPAVKNPKAYIVRMSSITASINEATTLNENSEFYFSDLALSDSTSVNLSLYNISDSKNAIDAKIAATVINGRRNFNKSFKPSEISCARNYVDIDFSLPKIPEKAIKLETVEITTAKPKSELTNEYRAGNFLLRGYKINKELENTYIWHFIRSHGFTVNYYGPGPITITGRISNTLDSGSKNTPLIYIDDRQVFSLIELEVLRMDQMDEIYINTKMTNPGLNNNTGIIKFYTKKKTYLSDYKGKSTIFTILKGFEKNQPFKNTNYIYSEGFENIGIINWIPNVTTDEDGKFKFSIPTTGKHTVKVRIEGATPEGKLISQIKTLNLEQNN